MIKTNPFKKKTTMDLHWIVLVVSYILVLKLYLIGYGWGQNHIYHKINLI
jgi:hypothetical protein